MAWLKPKGAAKYSGVGESTFRKWLKEGLQYSRLPSGAILVKTEWVDDFLEGFKVVENEANQIADIALKDF